LPLAIFRANGAGAQRSRRKAGSVRSQVRAAGGGEKKGSNIPRPFAPAARPYSPGLSIFILWRQIPLPVSAAAGGANAKLEQRRLVSESILLN